MNNKKFYIGDRVLIRGNAKIYTNHLDGKEAIITDTSEEACEVWVKDNVGIYYIHYSDLTLIPNERLKEAQKKIDHYRTKVQDLNFEVFELKGKLEHCRKQRDKYAELYVKEYWDNRGLSKKLKRLNNGFNRLV
jgi:predicted RNase H-like nuclease (RuvC/YqgF family)